MNETGISVDEACANNVIGTKEDFEQNCNPDGTVKQYSENTTLSSKKSDNNVSVDNTYLKIGLSVVFITLFVLVAIIIRKVRHKKTK